MKAERKRKLIEGLYPHARELYRRGLEGGQQTPVVWTSFGKKMGRIVVDARVADFEDSAYKAGQGGMFYLAHEIDAIEICPPGHFTLIAWLTNKEDSTVVHVPVEEVVA